MGGNPLDYLGENDPSEEEPTPQDQAGDADGGGKPAGNETSPQKSDDRVSRLERQISDMQGRVIDLLAQNAALRTSKRQEKADPPRKFTKEELKKFALEEGGKQQFDAAAAYIDQVQDNIKEELRNEYRQTETQKFIRDYMLGMYPELQDDNSEFSMAVRAEQQRVLNSGVIDPDSPDAANTAYNMALHRVGRGTRVAAKKPDSDYSKERRISESGAEGAPSSSPPDEKKNLKPGRLTDEEIDTAARMGLDLTKEGTRKLFKALQKKYEDERVP